MNFYRFIGVVLGLMLASAAQGADQKIAQATIGVYSLDLSSGNKLGNGKVLLSSCQGMSIGQARKIYAGKEAATNRYLSYSKLNSPQPTSLQRTIISGLAYATASLLASTILTQVTDKQWIKETFFYDQEVLGKKKKLLAITRERTIHEDNIKTLTARVPLAIDDAGLSAKLKELITQEIAKDCDAQKRQDTCKTEYNKLKTTKLGKK